MPIIYLVIQYSILWITRWNVSFFPCVSPLDIIFLFKLISTWASEQICLLVNHSQNWGLLNLKAKGFIAKIN